MDIVAKTGQMIVIDDFLQNQEFSRISDAIQYLNYRPMHDRGWVKAYGNPAAPVLQSELVTRGKVDSTPTGLEAVGRLVERVSSIRRELADTAAEQAVTITGRVVLSGVGAGLRWHNDAAHLSGAYVFYGHPRWNSHWGGELMILANHAAEPYDEESTVPADQQDGGPDHGFDEVNERRRARIGMGTYVSAKPNRLVLLSPGAHHRVVPVDAAAGDVMRASIAGFVVPDAALRTDSGS